MSINNLYSISPVDGRYSSAVKELNSLFSEYGLIKFRLLVEIEWFLHLSNEKSITNFSPISNINKKKLRDIYKNLTLKDSNKIKRIEKKTNHDVKAIEYYLKEEISKIPRLEKDLVFIHFACTSEDINNLAYSLMIKEASSKIILPKVRKLIEKIKKLSRKFSSVAMISYTHGQPASPTTMGKELANFAARLENSSYYYKDIRFSGKLNGAVGNYNAHVIAYPNSNWEKISKNFVENLGLTFNPYTTQIEPKDNLASLFHMFIRLNNILLDFSKDIWFYISLKYFSQKVKKDEVGSSTMPHKVNPIDFENAEGNLGLSVINFQHFANKLTISRLQRDLSDSTVMRNIGVTFSHMLIGLSSLNKGIDKLQIDKEVISKDLKNSWEILTEAIQTVLRKNKVVGGYELMKEMSRGREFNKEDYLKLISKLPVSNEDKTKLSKLTPLKYLGLAKKLAKEI
ncbi:MAG: adenylosuccinate lyase [Gammaproteobacteria bacterium]